MKPLIGKRHLASGNLAISFVSFLFSSWPQRAEMFVGGATFSPFLVSSSWLETPYSFYFLSVCFAQTLEMVASFAYNEKPNLF